MANLWVHSSEIFVKTNVRIFTISHKKFALSFQTHRNPVFIKWDSKKNLSIKCLQGCSEPRNEQQREHGIPQAPHAARSLGRLNIKNEEVLPTVWIFLRARVTTFTNFPTSSSSGQEQDGPPERGCRTEQVMRSLHGAARMCMVRTPIHVPAPPTPA